MAGREGYGMKYPGRGNSYPMVIATLRITKDDGLMGSFSI